jgi:hypothetical protein
MHLSDRQKYIFKNVAKLIGSDFEPCIRSLAEIGLISMVDSGKLSKGTIEMIFKKEHRRQKFEKKEVGK